MNLQILLTLQETQVHLNQMSSSVPRYLILYILINIVSILAGLFKHLPNEVHVDIYDYLSTTEFLKSLLTLNNHTYHNYFLAKYQDDIKNIKEIECIIEARMHQQINMSSLSEKIRKVHLNELYAFKLPSLLKTVGINHRNYAKLLAAMNIQTMPRNQFDSMPYYHYNDTLKLLIYASRNLAPFSFTEKCINDWHFSLHGDTAYYPWLTAPYCPCSVHRIYFGHLYEFLFDRFHKELNIPTLERLHSSEQSSQRDNVEHLIERHGFIPWHRSVIKQMRKNECICVDRRLETELYRIHRIVFDFSMDQNLSADAFNYILTKTFREKEFGHYLLINYGQSGNDSGDELTS